MTKSPMYANEEVTTATTTEQSTSPKAPFVAPKLTFVTPKVTKRGDFADLTEGFLGTFPIPAS